jgi:hypothetical protein
MARAVEHLFCKHEAKSSNPGPTKKKKKYFLELIKILGKETTLTPTLTPLPCQENEK